MKQLGFTLLELMIGIAIIVVLTAIAYPTYQTYIRKARLSQAYQAMQDDARMLEKYYANHGNFKQNSTTWAALTHTQTPYFCIKMQGNPRGTDNDNTYSLKAVALDKNLEPRVLTLSQDGSSLICENSTSSCSESGFFNNPSRADKGCTAYP